MFKERKSSLMKSMAILVCVAFILMVFPEVTQAATKPSSRTSPFLKESSPLISAVFSFIRQNLSPFGYDLAFFCSLSSNTPMVPDKDIKDNWDVKGKKKGYTKSNGNSTSQTKPEDKDK